MRAPTKLVLAGAVLAAALAAVGNFEATPERSSRATPLAPVQPGGEIVPRASEPASTASPQRRQVAATSATSEEAATSPRERRLRGRIRLQDGVPADERIVVRASGPAFEDRTVEVAITSRYELPFELSVADAGTVELEARYLRPAKQTFGERTPADGVVLEPELGGLLLGRVVELPHELERACVVQLLDANGRRLEEGMVDEDGRFELLALEPGGGRRLELFASVSPETGEPGAYTLRARRDELVIWTGRATDVELELERPALVAGRVLDATGRALADVSILAHVSDVLDEDWMRTRLVLAHTDADGRFRLEDVAGTELRLVATRSGHARRELELGGLAPGERREDLALTLEVGGSLRGLVLLPDGRPAAGAKVRLEQEDGPDGPGGSHHADADDEGRFQLHQLTLAPCEVRAVLHDARARDDPSRRERLTALVAGLVPGPGTLHLRLDAGETLRGRVVDDAGEPVRRFSVQVKPAHERAGDAASDDLTRTFESEDGRFELTGLAAGRCSVRVRAFHHANSEWREVLLPAEAPLELELERAIALAGLVRLSDGSPAARARVEARPLEGTDGERDRCRADLEGRFEALEVTPGTWRVSAELERMTSAEQLVTIARGLAPAELELVLQPGGHLRVELSRPDGSAIAGARVQLARPGELARFETTGSDGSAAFPHLAGGRYEIRARDASGSENTQLVEVAEGGTSYATLRLP